MSKEEYISLVIRNIKGELSEEEFYALNDSNILHPEWAQTRCDIEDVWEMSGDQSESTPQASDQDEAKFIQRVLTTVKESQPTNHTVTQHTNKNTQQSKNKDAKTIPMNWGRTLSKIAAVGIVILGALWLMKDNKTSYNTPGQYTLADNSLVTLRENSSVTLTKFDDESRNVTLQGEAYFEVTEDTQRPFVVQSNNLDITVLGTSFLVKEGNPDTYIDLTEGKLQIENTLTSDKLILTSGMKTRYSTDTGLELYDNYQNLVGWKKGIFRYSAVTLSDVINELTIIYNVPITLENKEMEKCVLNGTLSANNLDEILDRIASKFQLEIKENNSTKSLVGGVCR